MKYHMIERCREDFKVTMVCRLLNVSTSGYYDWRLRKPSKQQQDNVRLLCKIRQLHEDRDHVYGSPRIYDELRYSGETCSLNRVARLMSKHNMMGIPSVKQWKKT